MATRCSICKSRIPLGATIFPGEFMYSKNINCYPRVIRNPAPNREREGPRDELLLVVFVRFKITFGTEKITFDQICSQIMTKV